MEILISTQNDLLSIAKCQAICFPDSFAVKLGLPCIVKSLQWFLVNQNRFLVHIENKGKVIGFMGGFTPQFIGDGSKSGMLNYALKDAFKGLFIRPRLILEPELWRFGLVFLKNKWKRSFKNKKINQSKISKDIQEYLNSVAITIIAVHTDFRGQGVVDCLLDYAEKIATTHQKPVLCLGVKQKNKIASSSYSRNGWFFYKKLGDSIVMKKYINL